MINNLILHEQMIGGGIGDYEYSYETITSPNLQRKKLLEELINTPPIKIPLWIEQHKKQLKELGIKIKGRDNEKNI
jgi:hypothetical protein